MTDSTLNSFLARGTNAQRVAFTPSPPSPASGPSPTYIWHETDTGDTYAYNGTSWDKVNTSAATLTSTAGMMALDGQDGEEGMPIPGAPGAAGAAGGGSNYDAFGNLLTVAGLTPLGGASANITLTNYTKAHRYTWTASGANTVQLATMAAPATPWTLYLRFVPSAILGLNTQFGLVLRNSSTGKLCLFAFNNGTNLSVQDWTNPTTFSSQNTVVANQSVWWLKINNDGTTLTFYVGVNGVDWELFFTRTLAAFMGSVDQVGLGGVPQVAGGVWVSDFGFTTPS